ncbi:hypothetical protein [Streptomyces caatingaensis]|nr:hypothetical protein [Streptomyces caatingaensis]
MTDVLSLIAGVLGVLSAALGLVAEARRIRRRADGGRDGGRG